jgi:hypothetical protein
MTDPNLANLSRPGAVAGRVPSVYRGQPSIPWIPEPLLNQGTTCARDIAEFEIVPLR